MAESRQSEVAIGSQYHSDFWPQGVFAMHSQLIRGADIALQQAHTATQRCGVS
jgi:hypothetical protein